MLAGGGNGVLSVDIQTKQIEAGRGSRVKTFLVVFFYEDKICSLARLSGLERRLWSETHLTL